MKALKFISIFTIIIGFYNCGSVKFVKHPPFEISSAVYESWTGGQPGVQGTNVKINYTTNTFIEFDSIYFQNKVTKLQIKTATSGKLVIGYFNTSTRQNELVLDENPIKEMHNPIPEIKKFPFELNENEAVISYTIKGKLKYYKIKSLKKEKSIPFPSASKQ